MGYLRLEIKMSLYKKEKNMKLKRIISIVLLAVMMLSSFASCDSGNDSNGGETTNGGVVDTSTVLLTLASGNATSYTVVRPDICSNAVTSAAVSIKNELQNAAGCDVRIATDAVEAVEYEILVGQTNRAASGKALSEIKYNDYTVVVDGNKLVINAYSDEKLAEAASYVVELIKSKTNGVIDIKDTEQKTERATYTFETVYFGDIELKGYSIVIPNANNDKETLAAANLQSSILAVSGVYLPVKTDASEATEKEILVGETSRDESVAVDAQALGTYGYSVSLSGTKIVVKANDKELTLLKCVSILGEAVKSGKMEAISGNIEPERVLTTFMFTDVHNNFAMLEPTNDKGNYVIRQNVKPAISHLIKTVGKVDVVMVGGDLISDYPSWDSSGNWPYKYFVEFRALLVETFALLAKDGKSVIYVAGNHDYAQGELATDGPGNNGSYNSSDFYFGDVGMKQGMGELSEENMYVKVGEKTGDKYLLGYYYEVNGVGFMGLSPDHDKIWSTQGSGWDEGCLTWAKKKLDEVDPNGDKVIFVNCHYFVDMRFSIDASGYNNYGNVTVDKTSLTKVFLGHKNLYHIFGHGETWYSDLTVRYVTHHYKTGTPIDVNGTETDSTQVVPYNRRDFTSVYGGTFRPSGEYGTWFKRSDKVTGYAGYDNYGFTHHTTSTPLVAQGMYIEVFEDRVVFTMMNFGSIKPYRTGKDLIESYTVWLYK